MRHEEGIVHVSQIGVPRIFNVLERHLPPQASQCIGRQLGDESSNGCMRCLANCLLMVGQHLGHGCSPIWIGRKLAQLFHQCIMIQRTVLKSFQVTQNILQREVDMVLASEHLPGAGDPHLDAEKVSDFMSRSLASNASSMSLSGIFSTLRRSVRHEKGIVHVSQLGVKRILHVLERHILDAEKVSAARERNCSCLAAWRPTHPPCP